MHIKSINNIEIFRPDEEAESFVHKKVRSKLLTKFKAKRYTESKEITKIINFHFSTYKNLLDEHIRLLASRGFVEFLCFQYDQYALVETEHKAQNLSQEDEEYWQRYGILARRGIKYLLEACACLAIKEMNPNISKTKMKDSLSKIFIIAEELVNLYIESDQTHILFPDITILEINDEDYNYFNLTLDPKPDWNFDIREDTNKRPTIVGTVNMTNDLEIHNEILAKSFINQFGIDYHTVIYALSGLINNTVTVPDGLPVCFIKYDDLVLRFSEQFKIDSSKTKKILAGFTLDPKKMINEQREVFSPKQEYRALRRGFFLYPHDNGDHLLFSKSLAKESLIQLLHDVIYKKLPPEWMSKDVHKDLEKLSNKAGSWFERLIAKKLNELGLPALCSVKRLKFLNDKLIYIPSEVGEIDVLAYSEIDRTLIVIECKLVRPATEPKFYRNDLHSFIHSKKSYEKKFKKKYKWVHENFDIVSEFVTEKLSLNSKPTRLGYAMVTYYPSVAEHFINDFSCISIVDLIENCKQKEWSFTGTDI